MTRKTLPSGENTYPVEAFVTPERLAQLKGRLVDHSGDEFDVRWFTHDTPVGKLLIAGHGDALVRVAFERENFEVVEQTLMTRLGSRSLHSDRGFEAVRNQLDEYFTGQRKTFTVPVDFSLSQGPFRVAAQRLLPDISYGTTWTYQMLAHAAGRPNAVRAAASACANNPLPIVVPCHRVVRSDGGLGGYLGGTETKQWLLNLEHTETSAEPLP